MVRRLCISVYVLFSIKVRETCNIQLAKRFFIKHIAVSSNLLSSYFSPFVHSIFDIDMNNMYGLSWSLSFCILKVAQKVRQFWKAFCDILDPFSCYIDLFTICLNTSIKGTHFQLIIITFIYSQRSNVSFNCQLIYRIEVQFPFNYIFNFLRRVFISKCYINNYCNDY